MKRPKNWHDLPYVMFDRVIDGIKLDYDSYEGSYDEARASLLCQPVTDKHSERAQKYYDTVSDEQLTKWLYECRSSLTGSIAEIDEVLGLNT